MGPDPLVLEELRGVSTAPLSPDFTLSMYWHRCLCPPCGKKGCACGTVRPPHCRLKAQFMTIASEFCPITRASTDVVVRRWLSRILSALAASNHLPERMSWRHWQGALDRPQYTLGAWVGRNHYDKHWSVLPARSLGLEVNQTFERVPYITPWKSSPLTPSPSYLDTRMTQAKSISPRRCACASRSKSLAWSMARCASISS